MRSRNECPSSCFLSIPSIASIGASRALDESGASTQMTRNYGRAPRGERVAEATPNSHWHTLTMLAALTREGLQGP